MSEQSHNSEAEPKTQAPRRGVSRLQKRQQVVTYESDPEVEKMTDEEQKKIDGLRQASESYKHQKMREARARERLVMAARDIRDTTAEQSRPPGVELSSSGHWVKEIKPSHEAPRETTSRPPHPHPRQIDVNDPDNNAFFVVADGRPTLYTAPVPHAHQPRRLRHKDFVESRARLDNP